jgi:hypothetical protein
MQGRTVIHVCLHTALSPATERHKTVSTGMLPDSLASAHMLAGCHESFS